MRYSIHSNGPVAKVEQPPNPVNVSLQMPEEHVPRGVDDYLRKLGWHGEFSHADNTMFFRRDTGDEKHYGSAFYKWYEIVALDMLHFMSLGNSRPQAPTNEQLTAAANAINSQ